MEFTLKRPTPWFIEVLGAAPHFGYPVIYPKHFLDLHDQNVRENIPPGTGAFKYKDRLPGEYLVMEGMVEYYAQDEGTRTQIDNLWHEGYMRGLGQVEWEHDILSESNYNRGYKEALEKAFPNGDYPQYVNYPPREVKGNAIKTPEFDDKLKGLKDNTEVVDQLNDKIKQIKNE